MNLIEIPVFYPARLVRYEDHNWVSEGFWEMFRCFSFFFIDVDIATFSIGKYMAQKVWNNCDTLSST